MKFLVDRCAGRSLAEWLRRKGHDVVDAREEGPDPGDRELLARAALEGRVLVTMDKDFGEFLFAEGESHAGLVRLPNLPLARRIEAMAEILRSHAAALSERAIVTVRGGRVRVSRPPG